VAIVSGTRFAIMHELRGAPEPSFEEILSRLAPCDLVLIEGYKREPVPKIEARRLEANNREPLAPSDPPHRRDCRRPPGPGCHHPRLRPRRYERDRRFHRTGDGASPQIKKPPDRSGGFGSRCLNLTGSKRPV
jgi:hypothetical protein